MYSASPPRCMCVRCRVSIVEPVPDSTKLHVNEAGLQLLRSIEGHVAPIVVIGPYRSGKSFLINQMLDISCGAILRYLVRLRSSPTLARGCALEVWD